VDGEDLQPLPLLARRKRLEALLAGAPHGLLFSDHMDGPDGEAMFRHACRLGLEGIVSKKLAAPYLWAGARAGGRSRIRRMSGGSYRSHLKPDRG
jgi:ATP-dependent DNA ligase